MSFGCAFDNLYRGPSTTRQSARTDEEFNKFAEALNLLKNNWSLCDDPSDCLGLEHHDTAADKFEN